VILAAKVRRSAWKTPSFERKILKLLRHSVVRPQANAASCGQRVRVLDWAEVARSQTQADKILPCSSAGKSHKIRLMGIEELLKERRDEILRIAARHGAHNVRVFGSVVRGEAREGSDIDFLVDMDPGRTLLDMGGLLMDLRDALGRDVDVVTERGLKARIRERVLKEAMPL
jgi:uncharacterized protein